MDGAHSHPPLMHYCKYAHTHVGILVSVLIFVWVGRGAICAGLSAA